MLSFDQHDILYYVFMSKEPEDGRLFFEVPKDHTLIIRARSKGFVIHRSDHFPNPALMPKEGLFAKPSADFPQPNGPIPRAGKQVVTAQHEINARYVMLMAVEGLTALVLVA